MRLVTCSTVIAGALASAAIVAPGGSARLMLEPAGAPSTTSTASAAPAVRPNPDEQTTGIRQVGPPPPQSLRGAQLAALRREEAASAQPSVPLAPSARYSAAGLNGDTASTGGQPTTVRVTTHNNPFDWGDAAIGAAGGLVISLLIVGGVAVSQRRSPKGRSARALVS